MEETKHFICSSADGVTVPASGTFLSQSKYTVIGISDWGKYDIPITQTKYTCATWRLT